MKTLRKGRRAEHRVRDWLISKGYNVVRAAGSKGCFDLWACNDTELLLVAVKSGTAYLSAVERVACLAFKAPPFASKVVVRVPNRSALIVNVIMESL